MKKSLKTIFFNHLPATFRKGAVLVSVLSIGLLSCETLINDVNPDRLPRSDNKLVVHGYISPQDTLISINVYYSSQLVGGIPDLYIGSGPPVSMSDAVVTLSGEGKSVMIPYNTKTGVYNLKTSEMPIREGKIYDLKVVRGEDIATSSCTVPKAVAIERIRQDSVDSRSIFSSDPKFVAPKDYLYHIVWSDPAGSANYYRVGGYVFQTQRVQKSPGTFEEIPNIQNINFRENSRLGEFVSDEGNDGLLLVSGAGRFYNYNSSSATNPFVLRYVELTLISCEKTYYDYHRAVQSFDRNNPFSEPSLIPSNIKNGLGCFAAYNRSTYVLKK
ncbi:MAG: DUF4249 domain-containing protein [Spirosomataceae bacterium]